MTDPGPHVETGERSEELAFRALLEKIERERGFSCGAYKEKCLRRRITGRMRIRGIDAFAAYAALIDHEAAEYERLVDALTINVTKFFRNRPVFDAIARYVLPELARRDGPEIRLWSAGCSSGEEPYSLAILCLEYDASASAAPDAPPIGHRARIIGTDIDRVSLEAAQRGHYPEASFAETPADIRSRHFGNAVPHSVSPEMRAITRFERRDLLTEGAPFADVHLIVCRNVLIYFDRPTQERLMQRFHAMLAPSGFLVLGKVEMLLGQARTAFATVEARERVYRKQ